MNVNDYIVHETERQSGTMKEALGMKEAWRYLKTRLEPHYWRLVERDALVLVRYINGIDTYRQMPAVFNQGMSAMPASMVPHAMKRWGEQMNSKPFIEDAREYADYMTREFLSIHPFADGNGRVGSLVWNYLMRTIDNPEPMPYYFGDR